MGHHRHRQKQERAQEPERRDPIPVEVSRDPIAPWPGWLAIRCEGDPSGDWRLRISAKWGNPVLLVLLASMAIGGYIGLWFALAGRLSGFMILVGTSFLGYIALALVVNRTAITIDRTSLRVAHGPLPWPGGLNIPLSTVTGADWDGARAWVRLEGGGTACLYRPRDVGESERPQLISDVVDAVLRRYAGRRRRDESHTPSVDERSLMAWIAPPAGAGSRGDGAPREVGGAFAGAGEVPGGIRVRPPREGEEPRLRFSLSTRIPGLVLLPVFVCSPLALTWVLAHYEESMNWYIGEPLFTLHPVRFPIDVIMMAELAFAAYFLVVQVLGRTTLTLSPDTLRVRHLPLPFLYRRTLAVAEIRQLVVETVYWGEWELQGLRAVLMNGRTVRLLPVGQRKDRLEWLERALDAELSLPE